MRWRSKLIILSWVLISVFYMTHPFPTHLASSEPKTWCVMIMPCPQGYIPEPSSSTVSPPGLWWRHTENNTFQHAIWTRIAWYYCLENTFPPTSATPFSCTWELSSCGWQKKVHKSQNITKSFISGVIILRIPMVQCNRDPLTSQTHSKVSN